MPSISNIVPAENPLDLLWGVKTIGAEVGLPDRKVFYMLEAGLLPARKVGRAWVTTKTALRDALAIPPVKKTG